MKALVSFFVIVSMLVSFVMPAYALGSFTVEYTTRGKKYIMSDGTINGTYTGDDGSSITWTLTPKGTLTVSGSGCLPHIWLDPDNKPIAERIKTVTINSGITALDNCTFSQCSNMTTVSLPSSVTSIGFAAFASCPKLASIIIPSNITYIGEYAFYSCTALQSIALPSTVTMIDTEAFANCTALTSATVYGDIGTNAFNNCTALASLSLGGYPEYIGDGAFAYCESLTSVDIPSSVLEVGVGAFAYCEKMTSAIASGNLGESAFDCCYALKDVELGEYCTTIGRRCFSDCKALENITIPENVTEICDAAFQNCSSLKAINIPESVESLEDHAFYGCKELVQVNLLADLVAIEQCLFAYCEKLESIELPSTIKSIEGGAFGYCSSMTSIDIPAGCKTIAEKAFFGCQKLQSISVPNTLNSIGEAVFYECKELQGITIPQGIKAIPDHAFAFCESLSVVSLPAGLINIGNYAFTSCKKLDDVTLPSSIEEIGEYAFYECEAINSISVPQKVTVIPEGTFAMCSALKSIALPTTLTEIDKAAFIKCEALESIEIPDAVNYLGLAAFAGCKKLGSIALPAGITEILDSTFLDCTSLKNISIAGNIISIGDYSFASCESLEGIALPTSVAQIGKQAFSFCEKLSSVNLPDNLKKIGDAAFLDCAALKSLALGSSVQEIGDDAFAACTSLTNLTLDNKNKNFVISSNVLYNANKTRLISLVPADNPVSISIPNTVTNMGEMTFYRCDNIERVTLPSSIKEIGSLMFYSCPDLQSVVIPEGVTKIGEYAFSDCEKLNEVNIPSSVQSIEEGAFNNCKSLQSVEIPNGVSAIDYGTFFGCKSLNSIILPSSVTKIDSYAFAQCDVLSNVQFPQNLSALGEYAFAGCDSLADMNLPENLTSIGEGAFAECSALTNVALPSEISHVSDFLFYDCPSLESVYLRGGVFAIGVGSFSSSESLSKVVFAGNAPEVIGARAFEKTSSDLVLHYENAATGWTTPKWTGPDEAVYNTSTVYSGTCGEKLEWNLVTATGELTIWGNGEMYSWDSNNLPPWQPYKDLIKRVKIEEGVTSIGASAFQNCSMLATASIPLTVSKAGYAAFADCLNLNSIDCKGGLKATSDCMFYNNANLEHIEFSNELSEISSYAFYGCLSLQDVVLPSAIKTVNEGAFALCTTLKNLTIIGNLSCIGQGAFFNCSELASIRLFGSKPKSVSSYAFYGCAREVTLTGSSDSSWIKTEKDTVITSGDSHALSGTVGSAKWSIDISKGVLTISGTGSVSNMEEGKAPWSKYAYLISKIVVSEGITGIGDYAFSQMSNITSVSLPNTLHSMGQYAFGRCISLEEVTLPANVKELGEGVFSCCASLTSLDLSTGVQVIPDYMCSECYRLIGVKAAGRIKKVGYGAFYNCARLENVEWLRNVGDIDSWAFAYCLEIKEEIKATGAIGDYAFYCCGNISSADFSDTSSIGEYAFSQSGIRSAKVSFAEIPTSAFELCEALEEVKCQAGIETICTDAFYGCQNLKTLDLGQVTTLMDHAFMATGLVSVQLPASLVNYGEGVFSDCFNLETISSSGKYTAKDGVLYLDSKLIQYPAGKNTTEFAVPEYVDSIADYAFYGSRRLSKLVMGNNVVNLGKAAFALCDHLKEVTLGVNVSDLPEALFGNDTDLARVVFCGDAPSVIGTDAFYMVPDSVTFCYYDGRVGWTEDTWNGPDQRRYNTELLQERFTLLTVKESESRVLVNLSCDQMSSQRRGALVVAVSQEGKTIASKVMTFDLADSSYRVEVSANNENKIDINVFLLNAATGAPITQYCSVEGITPLVSNTTSVSIKKESVQANALVSRSTSGGEAVVSEREWNPYTTAELKLVSRSTGPEEVTVLKGQVTVNQKVFGSMKDGKGAQLTVSTQGITGKYNFSGAAFGEYKKDGEYKEGAAIGYLGTEGEFEIDFGDKYNPPRMTINGNAYAGAISMTGDIHFNIGSTKVRVVGGVEAFSGEASAKLGIHQDSSVAIEALDATAQANITNHRYEVIYTDGLTGNELLRFSANAGIGVEAGMPNVVKEVSKDKVEFSIGGGEGVHGGLSVVIHHKNIVEKFISKLQKESSRLKELLKAKLLQVKVSVVNDDGDEVSQIQAVFSLNDSLEIDKQIMFFGAYYLEDDQIFNLALPRTLGGTAMPTDSTQKTGGGNVNNNGKNNKLTQKQKDAVIADIVRAALSGKIPEMQADKLIREVEKQKAFADFNFTDRMNQIYDSINPGKNVWQSGGPGTIIFTEVVSGIVIGP